MLGHTLRLSACCEETLVQCIYRCCAIGSLRAIQSMLRTLFQLSESPSASSQLNHIWYHIRTITAYSSFAGLSLQLKIALSVEDKMFISFSDSCRTRLEVYLLY